MDFELTEGQRRAASNALAFARENLAGGADERDAARTFPSDLWAACGRERIHGWPVPEADGGGGLDPLETALAFEALGMGCDDNGLLFSVGAHLCVVTIPLWKFGSGEQRARWLARLCDGSCIGAAAITEPGAGSDPGSMRTSATPDGDGFLLTGEKCFITNAPVAELFVVYAMTDESRGLPGGVTAFLVERGAPGLEVEAATPTMGLRSAQVGALRLNGVRVAAASVLGRVGGGSTVFKNCMSWERVLLFAAHVGTMQRILDQTVAFAKSRVQSGVPIGKHQAVAHRLADMKVRLEAARLLVYKAAAQIDRAHSASLDASIAKLFVSEAWLTTAHDAIRTHGALGYATGPYERNARDAAAASIYSGTSDIQRNIIARWLGL